jgi:hypothetical protein
MVGYMNLEEQTDADFGRARRKAMLRRAMARLRRDPLSERPPCFEETRTRLSARGRVYRGLRVVRPKDVVGSVGRCSEFDRTFLPARASTEERWKRIDRAFHRAEEFPPVSLYKLGDAYFVLDGNHRVSVYRFHGVEWMDAEVTEFQAPSSIPSPKERGRADESSRKGGSKVHETMDFRIAKQRHEEMLREAEMNRLAKALRVANKQRTHINRTSTLTWELKRIAGRLLKLLKASRVTR